MQESVRTFLDTHDTADDLTLARDVVREAGQLALRMRRQGLTTEFKTSISDVVTEADRAAEHFVSTVLRELRPDDGILGEEGASAPSTSGRTWVIDPVDGTYNFTSDFDYWCSALALVEGPSSAPTRILLGAVHRPSTDHTWVGGPEIPTSCNGEKLPSMSTEGRSPRLAEISLGTYLHPSWMHRESVLSAWLGVARSPATIRMFGAASVDLALVASGDLGAWMQHSVKDWDWLPGLALVEGVGGVGRGVEAGGVEWKIAGPREIVDEIEALLKD
ncbi:inositol monophosphatase family protein [Corynebacterium uropygiale]|uniref:Inositol monophosphatase family protein n=1 Tax=Corynebacterium uropygiale TaxID=1775911 RepID=A0A9X1QTJ5_9CORY|nr:inositol monophosphatase family protein [Corynebacterium uropygiale]MCF4007568.1 inositol monophosphatase family protein [Corynebacterium uropygiale]